ncbi:hypothetical protein [Ensifer sp. LCM 4579]|uniref:hypothetical protein n=1 Tax=Ensifer sp. LCM 4579 TaxID=1848292 RepID=UPI0008DA90D1|nr:hypothetical protein [Ensifer sp. LCM 4579]OHV80373.1 hypothetical protein LCM4579_22575 [Ensifer sp. LCM 4579]
MTNEVIVNDGGSRARFQVTVIDLAEGHLHFEVEARGEEEAYDEASIAAAERGCQHVSEIIVGSLE